jgi:hypothetical protein
MPGACAFDAGRLRSSHEELDQLRILAVQAKRDPAGAAMLGIGRGDVLHHRVEVAEVVLVV